MLFTSRQTKPVFLSLLLLLISCPVWASGEDVSDQEISSVIGFYEQRDLELTSSLNQSHGGVFAKLNQTRTMFGKQRFTYHLTHPTNSLETLEKRQAAIATLKNDDKLAESINVLLTQIKDNQHGLEYFLQPNHDAANQHIVENYYFSFNFLKDFNASAAALSVRDTGKKIGLFAPVAEHLLIHLFMHTLTHDHDACNHWWDFLKPSKEVAQVLQVIHLGVIANSVYEMINHIQTETAVLNHLYQKIAAVRACFTSMHELYRIINDHSTLGAVCQATGFFASENAQLTELMQLFEGDYFDTGDSLGFFSTVGSTLRANSLLKKYLATWQHALDGVGDIDVYLSVAQLMELHASKIGKLSFVRFVQSSDSPYICMKGLWNFMLDADTVVTNDVLLGQDQPPFIVETGPNKAGKSSILKGLGLCIVLAQAFGIACAVEAVMTIVDKLITYIIVTDDITKDMSLMVAEMARADACVTVVQNLKPGQHACILLDDSLFKGTAFKQGQDLAYAFVKTLGSCKQACGMIATHTALLTQLEASYPSVFKNYYIPTYIQSDGRVASSFHFQPGISSPDHVLDIVQTQR